MLDINFIRENADYMKDVVKKRNMDCDIDLLLSVYAEYKKLGIEIEEINRQINLNTKSLKDCKSEEDKSLCINNGRKLKDSLRVVSDNFAEVKGKFDALMLTVPNDMAEDTPIGEDDSCNVEVFKFSEPTKFDFKPKSHTELGKDLDLIDIDRASKVAGSKFYFLKNELVQLQLALETFVIRKLVSKGFTPVITPDVAKTSILLGSGFNPRGAESNIYKLEDLDLNLIATAEITIGGMHGVKRERLVS